MLTTTFIIEPIIYTYYLENLTSATSLHFIFIKSPTITYDSNGGKPYKIEDRPHLDEDENVYSFLPLSQSIDENSFVPPYVSKAAEGQNDGWKFLGWRLTGDIMENIPADTEQVNADQLGSLLLPAVHSVACDYNLDGAAGITAAQYFKIYDGNVSFTKNIYTDEIGEILGANWNDGGATKLYANIHRGLTMVAQWRWRQAFIPQTVTGGVCSDSSAGGTVEITNVTNPADENYNATYTDKGGKSYHAELDETITVKAIPKTGWKFIGWYDSSGKLVSTNAEYGYVEISEAVNTYYARFADSITQTYIRQVKNGDSWEDITDDAIGVLDRYSYTDAVGMPISSTASAGKGYRFVGWYDSYGKKVEDSMIINNGTTISYITTDDATYYARYENAYTLHVSKIDEDVVTGYTASYAGSATGGFIITNRHKAQNPPTPDGVSVWVQKKWEDENNKKGLRPNSVTVQLIQNGTVYKTAQLNSSNDWKFCFDNLPNAKYTVKEISPKGYHTSYLRADGNVYTVINTLGSGTDEPPLNPVDPSTIGISVKKVWDDRENAEGLRPDKITVSLIKDGKAFRSAELSEQNDWQYEFLDVPKNAWYSIYEDINGKYTVAYSGNAENGYVITNSYPTDVPKNEQPEPTNPALTDIPVYKIWNDSDNAAGKRPQSVMVHLIKDGSIYRSLALSADGGWKGVFSDVPADGAYSITEDAVLGYTTHYATDSGFIVTNTYTQDETNPGTPPKPFVPAINDNIPSNEGGFYEETVSIPQTGSLNWPVPVLAALGTAFLLCGLAFLPENRRKKS